MSKSARKNGKRLAFGYTRVSTGRQVEEGISLDVQEEKIRTFCKLRDLHLVEIFSDRGISGMSTNKRAGIAEAIRYSCHYSGVLVFYDLTRLARNARDALHILDRLDKDGAHLASATETIDSSSNGRLLFTMLAAMAEWQSRASGEKVAAANRLTVKRLGYRTQGVQPYGYTFKNGNRVPHPPEQAIAARIRAYAASVSCAAIADQLNADGVKARRGGLWKPGTVWRVRSNKNSPAGVTLGE